MNNQAFYIKYKNVYIVPVCHYQVEFARCVRKAFLQIEPDAVAVELPFTLEYHIKEAVERFPLLSVVFYQNGEGEYIYFPVEPSDPLAEAVRSGLEMEIPVRCIDYDTDDYPLVFDPMPDSYSVHKLGLETYYNLYARAAAQGKKPEEKVYQDHLREECMGYYLQQMMKDYEKVLFVCGAAHVPGILEGLKHKCARPMGKVFRRDLQVYNLSSESIREVTGEIPFITAVYEMSRGRHDLESEIREISETVIEREKAEKPGETGKIIPFEEMRKKINNRFESESASPEDGIRALVMEMPGHKRKEKYEFLRQKKPLCDKIGQKPDHSQDSRQSNNPAPEKPILENTKSDENNQVFQNFMKKLFARLFSLQEADSPNITGLEPKQEKEFFDIWYGSMEDSIHPHKEKIHKFRGCPDRWEELMNFYRDLSVQYPDGDRQMLIFEMLKKSSVFYTDNVNEEIKPWQLRTFMKFALRYALVTGRLIPDIYQLIVCARSSGDDNFAHEVWDLLTYYPWLDRKNRYQTIDIKADQVWLAGKKIILRRKFPYYRKQLMHIPVKRRKEEKKPGQWGEDFDKSMLCSYPPEDIVVENFGNYLQKKGMNILSEEHTRVQPFTSSILDGVDVRETLRNWHEKKIYVREKLTFTGGVGSVCIIFEEDPEDTEYPWKLTWLGEHHQESDMALYSTYPGNKIVGPGIARCTYGGFMMTYPPGRVWEVWSDPFYSHARSKSEKLLMSAVEYSREKNVVYVAAKPPRSYFKSFASGLGRRIIYIPIGTISPVTLKKMRVFHVLSGNNVREIAKDYIW